MKNQGKQFQNREWLEELLRHNIHATLTSIRTPQSNLAERVSKQLKRLFRIYWNKEQSKWPEYVEFFEGAIKNCYNDTTGYTPMELQEEEEPVRVWKEWINMIYICNVQVSSSVKMHMQKIGQRIFLTNGPRNLMLSIGW